MSHAVVDGEVNQLHAHVQDEAAQNGQHDDVHGHQLLRVLDAHEQPPEQQHRVDEEEHSREGKQAVRLRRQLAERVHHVVVAFKADHTDTVVASTIRRDTECTRDGNDVMDSSGLNVEGEGSLVFVVPTIDCAASYIL